jgi:tetratricopeptide (TPR) repeat protein
MNIRYHIVTSVILFSSLVTGLSSSWLMAKEKNDNQNDIQSVVVEGQLAPRLQKLGDHKFPVTTDSDRAQLFINQGMNLTYGFNHKEADRSFKEAARLDPDCAMAYWGMALALGPNINLPMSPDAAPLAYEFIQKAISLKDKVSAKEQVYIDALAVRYAGVAPPDRKKYDLAYADAMKNMHMQFPNDLDVATLYAESVMNLRPWDYWTRDGKPFPETVEIMNVLESVLAQNPNHPGAIHLYIHTVEYARPQLAESGADRLLKLVPGAGHLVHMPSHIYRRIGRYDDATLSNLAAIEADEDYITQCRAQGVYPLAYYPHNIHFLWDSATMEGRSVMALEAAQKSSSKVPEGVWRDIPLLHQFLVAPLFAYTRFGKWDMILAEPQPPEDSPFWNGIWHYARGLSFTAKGDLDAAGDELSELKKISAIDWLADYRVTFSRNGAKAILDISISVLSGEIQAKQGKYDAAIAELHRGVLLEDNLIYNEPPDWHIPVRQVLGAVLIEAGRPEEAEAIYWQDLRQNRENGWSLFGLMQSLRSQGKKAEAEAIETRFDNAWSKADIVIPASRIMDNSAKPSSNLAGK